jgi:hypothetical protein
VSGHHGREPDSPYFLVFIYSVKKTIDPEIALRVLESCCKCPIEERVFMNESYLEIELDHFPAWNFPMGRHNGSSPEGLNKLFDQ